MIFLLIVAVILIFSPVQMTQIVGVLLLVSTVILWLIKAKADSKKSGKKLEVKLNLYDLSKAEATADYRIGKKEELLARQKKLEKELKRKGLLTVYNQPMYSGCNTYKKKALLAEYCAITDVLKEYNEKPVKEKQGALKREIAAANDTAFEPDPLVIIKQMEDDFASEYQRAYYHVLNDYDCKKIFESLCKKWSKADNPIPVQIRYEQLEQEYRDKFEHPNPMILADAMNGHEFENWCADLLRKNGYQNVSVTPGSGDQGVDVLAEKDGIHYAIQCKCYQTDLGNTPIQEVYAGKEFYRCQVGVVMTNRHFTPGAKQLAEYTRVLLWDRDKILNMIASADRRYYDTSFEKRQTKSKAEEVEDGCDEMLPAAVDVILETGQTSVSMLQRRLNLGYSRTARLVDQMEERGIVGPFEGSKPRQLLITKEQWQELQMKGYCSPKEAEEAAVSRSAYKTIRNMWEE